MDFVVLFLYFSLSGFYFPIEQTGGSQGEGPRKAQKKPNKILIAPVPIIFYSFQRYKIEAGPSEVDSHAGRDAAARVG